MPFLPEQAISIVRGLSSVEVMEPKEARFRVETSIKAGRAPKWTLNGALISSSPEVKIEREGTSHRLTFMNTNSSMCGIIQFSSGKSRSTAQLTVTGKERKEILCVFPKTYVLLYINVNLLLQPNRAPLGGHQTHFRCGS